MVRPFRLPTCKGEVGVKAHRPQRNSLSLGAVYDSVKTYVPGLWALIALSLVAAFAVYLGDRRPARA
jgi:hypothetical protein